MGQKNQPLDPELVIVVCLAIKVLFEVNRTLKALEEASNNPEIYYTPIALNTKASRRQQPPKMVRVPSLLSSELSRSTFQQDEVFLFSRTSDSKSNQNILTVSIVKPSALLLPASPLPVRVNLLTNLIILVLAALLTFLFRFRK